MDWFWGQEKPWYASASSTAQARARNAYVVLFRISMRIMGRSFTDYVSSYRGNRGMNFYHDVHDWMGGWPYESILPQEVEGLMGRLGFDPIRVVAYKGRLLGRHSGLFGSGCDEYVYRRRR
jgi:2-polyprenyl-6-hydroxyphenyl methylase/3-demethylubiquinone-9 3-methyltransferase